LLTALTHGEFAPLAGGFFVMPISRAEPMRLILGDKAMESNAAQERMPNIAAVRAAIASLVRI